MPASSSVSPTGADPKVRRVSKKQILLAGIALLTLAALAFAWFSREPVVDGQPISYWIYRLHVSGSGSYAALDKLGPEKTLPYLLRIMDGKDRQPFYRRFHSKTPAFLRQRLPAPQPFPNGFVQTRVSYYFVHVATNHPALARMAVPRLVPLIESSNLTTRHTAAVALTGFGSNAAPAVPVIQRLLKNTPENSSYAMLMVLEKCGPEARPTIPTLRTCLGNTNSALVIQCARTLWTLDPSQADLVRPVAQRLSAARDAGIRLESASLLWRMDTNPPPVVPIVIGLLNEDDHPYDYRTFKLLKQIGPAGRDAIPALTAWLNRNKGKEAFTLKAANEALDAMRGTNPASSATNTQ